MIEKIRIDTVMVHGNPVIVDKLNEIIDQIEHINQDVSRLYANDHINELKKEDAEKCNICKGKGSYYNYDLQQELPCPNCSSEKGEKCSHSVTKIGDICPKCHGTGKYVYPTKSGQICWHCDRCGGTGKPSADKCSVHGKEHKFNMLGNACGCGELKPKPSASGEDELIKLIEETYESAELWDEFTKKLAHAIAEGLK